MSPNACFSLSDMHAIRDKAVRPVRIVMLTFVELEYLDWLQTEFSFPQGILKSISNWDRPVQGLVHMRVVVYKCTRVPGHHNVQEGLLYICYL